MGISFSAGPIRSPTPGNDEGEPEGEGVQKEGFAEVEPRKESRLSEETWNAIFTKIKNTLLTNELVKKHFETNEEQLTSAVAQIGEVFEEHLRADNKTKDQILEDLESLPTFINNFFVDQHEYRMDLVIA